MFWLKVILALFPARFQRQFGGQWQSVAEDVLRNAKSQGNLPLLRAWCGLALDTTLRAPVAHTQEWQHRIMGQQPVLAGLAPGALALTLARHWVWRPAQSLLCTLARYGTIFIFGTLMSLLLHMWMEYRAISLFVETAQVRDDLLSSPSALSLSYVGLVFFLVALVSLHHGKRRLRRWKAAGFPVVAPVATLVFGVIVGLHIILLMRLPTVAVDVIPTFDSFAKHRDIPTPIPYDEEKNWTSEQRKWFYMATSPSKHLALRPENKDQWCAIRMANLGAQEIHIRSGVNLSTDITALLWNGQMAVSAGFGCLTQEELIDRHTSMALFVQSHPSVYQLTWEQLPLLPLFDRLAVARYIIQPGLFPKISSYCPSLAFEEAKASGSEWDVNRVSAVCREMETKWAEQNSMDPPPSTLWQRAKWRLGLDYTGFHRRQAQATPRMGKQDLAWIRQQLRAQRDGWSAVPANK